MRLNTGVLAAVLLLAPGVSLAQTAGGGPDDARIFVDLNFGVAKSLAHERRFTSLVAMFGEVATFRADYPRPALGSSWLDVGVGFMLKPFLGIGVNLARTTYEDGVDLTAIIPHPVFLNAPATKSALVGSSLRRDETAAHIFAVWVPVRSGRSLLRFFAGPTYFVYTAEMVSDIAYDQTFAQTTPQNSITITGFSAESTSGSGFGFHAGADYAYFFTRRFGVAGGVRFSRGTLTLDPEPLSTIGQEIRVGSTQVFAGVRFRFGG